MRKLLLAATAAVAITASPALARDNSFYVGVEGGAMLVEDMDLDFRDAALDVEDAAIIDYNVGFDVDLIGGYDMGALRLEAELAYKRAGIDELTVAQEFSTANDRILEGDGRTNVLSAMANLLLDFGDDAGWSGYVGGGAGLARVRVRGNANAVRPDFPSRATDNTIAWQAIAGFRAPVTPTLDLGLKYRFFTAPNLSFDRDEGPNPFDIDTRFRSHSLLASLIFNFVPPAPVIIAVPPPPPPPPPATQTCPDGSVILATDVCPAPPPPPPPPPAGERG